MKKQYSSLKNIFILFILVMLGNFVVLGQNLVHNFEFNNNLNDTQSTGVSLTESNTSSSSFGTSPNSWTWTQGTRPGGGLDLLTDQLPDETNYSLGFRIEFDQTTSGYRKIITFRGAGSDNGLYFFNGNLILFPGGTSTTTYTANTFYDFVLTRASNNTFRIYTISGGTATLVYDITDTAGNAIPILSGANRQFRFFMNDNDGRNEHTTGGTVRSIRMWDRALTAAEIEGALSSAITHDASTITNTGATLNGEVNPQGSSSTFSFEWGTTTAYGNTLSPTTPVSSSSSISVDVSGALTGLVQGQTYHYRIKSTTGSGDTFGGDKTFITNRIPSAVCQNLTLQLDASGNGTITPTNIDSGSSDPDGDALTLSLDQTVFDCTSIGTPIIVTLTVTDTLGNTDTCTATVTVVDNISPTAVCQNLTVQLDATGNVSITPTQINNGSNDNCNTTPTLSLDKTSFTCADVGANTVTLTVDDGNGQTSTCTAIVTVEDNITPTAVCQDITVQLDATGNVSITPAQIDNGSSDNCALTLSLDKTDFTCVDVGENTVTLTINNGFGQTSTCTATVTVEDNITPTAVCQDIIVQLDTSGNASITSNQVNNGSNDNCSATPTLSLDKTSFTIADVGDNTVTLTVTDPSGHSDTCTATVTVRDNVAPGGVLSNLDLWLKADAGTNSIGTSWQDQSAQANHYTTATGPTVVANALNYNDGVEILNGGFDAPSGAALTTDWSVFFISKKLASDLEGRIFDGNTGNYLWAHHSTNRNGIYLEGSPSDHGASFTTNLGLEDLHLHTYTRESSGALEARTDGLSLQSYASSNSASGIRIRINRNGSELSDSRVGEMILYDRRLSATEVNKVESYLGIKYSVTLSSDYTASNDTKFWDASLTPAYQNGLIGIGRDSGNDLIQKQSQTNNDNFRIYIDALAAGNTSNSGAISNNISYLMVGNDNNALSSSGSVEFPASQGIKSRIDREWKITNTNFSDTFSLDLKLSSSTSDISKLRLLVDTDGNFTNATVLNPTITISGAEITVSGLSSTEFPLDATRYFTLATVNEVPVITSTPVTAVDEDSLYSYTLNATDVEDDDLVYTGVTLPSWMSLVSTTSSELTYAVAPNFTPQSSSSITNFTIDIVENFTSGDVLSYTGSLPAGVTGSYNSTTGVYVFTGTTTAANWQTLLRTVELTLSNSSTAKRVVNFTENTNGNILSLEVNGDIHYYELITSTSAISWTDAKNAATAKTFYGREGYLATVMSQAEQDVIEVKVSANTWIGASDAATEDVWEWVTGPEAGTQFWQGNTGGAAVNGQYNNWVAGGEPNDSGGEDYAHMLASNGLWNDFSGTNSTAKAYLVEYGGMPDDTPINITQAFNVRRLVTYTLTGTPLNADVGVHDVSISVADGTSTVLQDFQVTVTNTNDIPTASNNSLTILEDITLTFTPNHFNYSDIDVGDSLHSIFITSLPNVGTLQLSNVDVVLNQEILEGNIVNLVFTPPINAFGIPYTSFNFKVNDGEVSSAGANAMTINVTAFNNAPSITSTAGTTATEDTEYTYTTAVTDVDDTNDGTQLTYSLSNAPTGMVVSPTGVITWTPLNGVTTSGAVTLTVSDGGEDSAAADTEVFTIAVTVVNDAPSITSTAGTSATEDIEYTYTTAVTDVDDVNDGTQLTYSLTNAPTGMVVSTTGVITWTPLNGVLTSGAVTLTVADGGEDSAAVDTEVFTIAVIPVNDAPSITSTAGTIATEDTLYTYITAVTDVDDINNGTDLTYTLTNAPTGMVVSSTGIITWTPLNGVLTSGAVTLTVADGGEDSAVPSIQGFIVSVISVNDVPNITSTAGTSATEDTLYTYATAVTDVDDANDGTQLTYTLTNAPTGMVVSATGVITWTPLNGVTTSGAVTLTVADGGEDSAAVDTEVFTIAVTVVNDEPIITSTAGTTAIEDTEYTYATAVTDVDDANNGIDLTYTLTNAPTGMVVNSTGVITWTPLNGVLTSGAVTLTVADGGEDSAAADTEIFTVSVTVVNDAPSITSTAGTSATEDIEYTYTTAVTDDDDANDGTQLIYSLTNAPTGMVVSNTGVLTWTPLNGVLTSGAVTLTVADGGEDSAVAATEIFTVSVIPVNDGPVITSTAGTTATEDTLYTYTSAVTDVDDLNNGIDLTYTLTNAPTGMVVGATGEITWTPLNGVITSGAVTLTVADGGEDSAAVDTEVFTIAVTAVNDAPVITSTAGTTATEDTLYTYTTAVTDVDDSNNGTDLTYTLTNAPTGMVVSATGEITWTPLNGVTTSGAVTLTVADGGENSAPVDTEVFTVAVTVVNDAPSITSTAGTSATEDTLYTYTTAVTDVDDANNGTDLTYTLTNAPAGMVVSSTGDITWTPLNGVLTSGAVTLTVADGGEDSAAIATEIFTITVTVVNDAPVITSTAGTTATEDTLYTYTSAVTDVDDANNGTDLTYALTNAPTGMVVSSTGVITWTPLNGVTTSGAVTLTVADGGENSATSDTEIFTISVTTVNDAPSITSTAGTVATEDTLYTYTTAVTDVDDLNNGTDLTYTLTNAPTGMVVSSVGVITWTPLNGVLTSGAVTLTVADGGENSSVPDTEIFTISVIPVNDAPSITSTAGTTATEDTLYTYTIAITDVDDANDGSGALSYTLTNAPAGMDINSTGVITWTPLNGVLTSGTVTLTVVDGGENGAAVDTEIFTISVTPVNDAPSITSTAGTEATEDTEYIYTSAVTDVDDLNNGTDLTYTLTNAPTGMVVSSTGVITWTPLNGVTTSGPVTLTVADGGEDSATVATEAFTVNVTIVNDAPIITSTAGTSATEDMLYTYATVVTDVDDANDGSGALTYTLTNAPTGMAISSTGVITWTPLNGVTASGSIILTVADGGEDGAAASIETFTIVVTPVNDAPSITSTAGTTATEDTEYIYTTAVTDVDDSNNGTDLTYTLTNAPAGMVVSSTGVITWTPLNGVTTSGAVTLTVADGGENGATTSTEVFTISVTVVNDAPSITSTAGTTATEDTLYTYTTTVTDVDDANNGTDLTYTLTNAPTGMVVSSTGVITWTPLNGITSTGTIQLTVSDGGEDGAAASIEAFTIVVTPVNDAPSITSTAGTTATEDTLYTYTTVVTDVDDVNNGTDLTYTLANAPTGMVVSTIGVITWTPLEGVITSGAVTLTVADGGEDGVVAAIEVFTISVTVVNDAPSITSTAGTTATEDTLYTYVTAVTDVDDANDGSQLTYSLTNAPTGMVISSTGVFTWTPLNGVTTSGTVTLTVSDGGEDGAISAIEVFTISVTVVNDAPSITSTAGTTATEDTLYTYPLSITDVDDANDGSGALTFSLTNAPGGMVVSSTGVITWTPLEGILTSGSVTVTVADGGENSAAVSTETFTVLVTTINDAPVITSTAITTATEDIEYTYTSEVTDVDDANNGTDLTYTLTNAPTGMVVSSTGVITWTPLEGVLTSGSVTLTVADGGENGVAAAVEIFVVTVTAVNDAPVAIGESYSLDEGELLTVTSANGLLLNDTDQDRHANGDPIDVLTVELVTGTSTGALVIDSTTGSFTYQHNGNNILTDNFTYQVSDGVNLSNIVTVNFSITEINDAPHAEEDTYFLDEGTSLVLPLLSNDEDSDGDAMTVEIVIQPTHGTLVNVSEVYTYTHDGTEIFFDSFSYRVQDARGAWSNTVLGNLNINPVNDLPVAVSDSYTVLEDSGANPLSVLLNDTDAEGATPPVVYSSLRIVTNPSHGTVSVDIGTGIVQYTPDSNYSGSDSFTYNVSDLTGGVSLPGTVNITVTPLNDKPNTSEDFVSVAVADPATPVDIYVLSNDDNSDEDDIDLLSLTIVSNPSNGTVSIVMVSGVPVIRYIPNDNSVTIDELQYTISDTSGLISDPTDVRISFIADNLQPKLLTDSFTDLETDGTVVYTIDILSNDTPGGSSFDSSTLTLLSPPLHGSAVVESGVIKYTPTAYYNGSDSFTYGVQTIDGVFAIGVDGSGTATGTGGLVSITLTSVENAAAAVNDDVASLVLGGTTIVNVIGNDTDPDTDIVSSQNNIIIVSGVTGGTAIVVNGMVEFTSDASSTEAPGFTYYLVDINDPSLVSNIATVTITLSANQAPVVYDQHVHTLEEQSVAINLQAFDIENDVLTWSVSIAPNQELIGGVLTDVVHGTLTGTAPNLIYTPEKDYFIVLADNAETGNHDGHSHATHVHIVFTVTDSGGNVSNQGTVQVGVGGVQDPPIIRLHEYTDTYNTIAATADAGTTLSVTMRENTVLDLTNVVHNRNVDKTDLLTWITYLSASNGISDISGYSEGVWDATENAQIVTPDSFIYTPTADYYGTDAFTAKVYDPYLNEDELIINVTIIQDLVTDTDGDWVPDSIERDNNTDLNDITDYADTDGDEVPDYVETNQGTDLNNGDDWLNTDGDTVPDYVEAIESTDENDSNSWLDTNGNGYSDYQERHNTGPVITSIAVTAVDEDVLYSYTITATDVDVADVLVYSATQLPTWLSFDTSTQLLSGIPTNDDVGIHEVIIQVTDGMVPTTQTFSITVAPINDGPVITSIPGATATEDILYTYTTVVVDVDDANDGNGSLQYMLSNAPDGMIVSSTGVITWTPLEGVLSSGAVTLTVTDGGEDGSVPAVQIFTVLVTPVNEAPSITSTAGTTATEDTLYTYTSTVSDVDDANNGTDLSYTLTNAPTGMVVTTTGVITWTPLNGVTTSGAVTLTASDGGEDGVVSATEVFTVLVTAVNDAPSITSTAGTTATEDILYTYTTAVTDVDDANNGTDLTYTLTNAPTGMVVTTTGVITWTPLEGVLTSGSVTLTVTDGGENGSVSDTQIFTVMVIPVNDSPTITTTAGDSATEDNLYTYAVGVTDVDDSNNGTDLTYTLANAPTGMVVNSTGVITWTPLNGVLTSGPVTLTVSDGGEDGAVSATENFTVSVLTVNDAPSITSTAGTTATEDTLYTYPLSITDVDDANDGSGALTFSLTNAPVGMVITSTGVITWTPLEGILTSGSVTVTVADGGEFGAVPATEAFNITVTPINDAPIITSTAGDSATEDVEYTYTSEVTDVDDANDGTQLTYSLTNAPTGMAVNSTGVITWIPLEGVLTSGSVTLTVADGGENGVTSATETFVVTVTAVNDAPVAIGESYSLDEGELLTVTSANGLLLNDTDQDRHANGDPIDVLTVELVTGTSTGALVIDAATGSFTYQHNGNNILTDNFTYQVSDGVNLSNIVTVNFSITEINDAPHAEEDTYFLDEGTSLVLPLLSNDEDADGDAMTVDIVIQPTHGTLVNVSEVYTYTHDGSQEFFDSFSYRVQDARGAWSNTVLGNLNINPINDIPVAVTDSYTVLEDSGANPLTVLLNDTDEESPSPYVVFSSLSIDTNPSHGTVSVDIGTGVVQYNPTSNYSGSDSFTYVVSDLSGGVSLPGTVNITVTPLNDRPTTLEDFVSVAVADPATPVDIYVLSNDDNSEENDIDLSSLTIVNNPGNGTVSIVMIAGVPVIRYTPNNNSVTIDELQYTISDTSGLISDPTDVRISFIADSLQPKLLPDSFTDLETEGTVVYTIDVLANDTPGGSSFDNSTLVLLSPPLHGSAVVESGVLKYTPTAYYNGLDSFIYGVQTIDGVYAVGVDGSGTATGTGGLVSITLTSVENAAAAVNDDVASLVLGGTTIINVIGNDTDPDTDVVSSQNNIIIVSGVTGGTAVVVNGMVEFTSDASSTDPPGFTYYLVDINDPSLVSNVATVTITLSANQAPVVYDQHVHTVEEQSVPINLQAFDIENDVLTWSVSIAPNQELIGGVLTDVVHGTITGTAPNLIYTPEKDYFIVLADNAGTGNHDGHSHATHVHILFTVTDSGGNVSNQGTVQVGVGAVQDPPIIRLHDYTDAYNNIAATADAGPVLNVTMRENTVLDFTNVVHNRNVDITDLLTWITYLPASHGITNISGYSEGVWDATENAQIVTPDSFIYTPTANYYGTDTFTAKVYDPYENKDELIINITIEQDLVTDTDGDWVPDSIERDNNTDLNDITDYADADGDEVPDYVETNQGTDVNNADDWLNTDGDTVPDYVEAIESTNENDGNSWLDTNGNGYSDYQERHNTGPVITSIAVIAVDEDVLYNYTVTATDVDVSDVLVYSATQLPTWLSFDTSTQLLTGIPTNDDVGIHEVTIQVTDGMVPTTQTFSITVTNINGAPVITEGAAITVIMSKDGIPTPFALTLNATDEEGDVMTWSINTQATNGTSSASGTGLSRSISYTPTTGYVGSDIFIVQVTDAIGASTTIEVTVLVIEDPDGDGVANAIDLDDDNDGILDSIESNGDLTLDTDSDGIPNHLDDDSDGDNCNDVTEVYGVGSDTDGNGYYGAGIPTVDANGLVIAAGITGSTYNTLPLDNDTDGGYDFLQDSKSLVSITSQPVNVAVTLSSSEVEFSVAVETIGTGTEVSYQWEEQVGGTGNWNPISDGADFDGTTTETLVVLFDTADKDTNLYRVLISTPSYVCDGDLVSESALLSIESAVDLSVEILSDEDTPAFESTITFTVTASNAGLINASNVEIVSLLPSGYNFTSAVASSGTYDDSTGIWSVGTIANGGSVELIITAIVNETGVYENCAEITALDQFDSDSSNNISCTLTNPFDPIQEADLELSMTVSENTPVIGLEVEITLILTNNGPDDATGITVLDNLPSGYEFISYDTSQGSYDNVTGIWNVGGLINQEQVDLIILAKVLETGDYFNIGWVETVNELDPDSTPGNDDHREDDYAEIDILPTILIEVPELFTPNGDGNNDVFIIPDLQSKAPNFRMVIINRYGDKVYEYSHNGNAHTEPEWWDGLSDGSNFGGDELPTGTYFYTIYFNLLNKEPQTGWVYLRK